MEFTSIVGSQHTIEPIGYMQLRKKLRSDVKIVVRSIREQFLIHSIASDFKSHILFIPDPIRIESSKSYTMSMIYHFTPMDPNTYKNVHDLLEELIKFKNYMYINGYFAAGFSILHNPGVRAYALVDFSQFGTIDSNFVMFPKIPLKYTILEAETQFGLLGRDIVTESFKNKHLEAKSPQPLSTPPPPIPELILETVELETSPPPPPIPELSIQTYILDTVELETSPPPSPPIISLPRTISESLFEIQIDGIKKEIELTELKQWDKIDSFISHVNS